MWVEKYHCDGLRMDATSYIRYEGGGLGYDTEIEEGNILMRDINAELQEKYPHVLTIAEDLKKTIGLPMILMKADWGGMVPNGTWPLYIRYVRYCKTPTTKVVIFKKW